LQKSMNTPGDVHGTDQARTSTGTRQERTGQNQVKPDLVVVLTHRCCMGYPASTGGAHRGPDSRAAGPATITGRAEIIEQKLRRGMIRPWPRQPSGDPATARGRR